MSEEREELTYFQIEEIKEAARYLNPNITEKELQQIIDVNEHLMNMRKKDKK